jgi:hypothetical protein
MKADFPVVASSAVPKWTQEPQIFNLPGKIAKIATHYFSGYKWGALLQALSCKGILQRDIPPSYWESIGPIMVNCGSLDVANWQ